MWQLMSLQKTQNRTMRTPRPSLPPAIESANRLLDAACGDSDLPLVARISVLHGIAMLRENGPKAATQSFDESLGLHTAWAGRGESGGTGCVPVQVRFITGGRRQRIDGRRGRRNRRRHASAAWT